MKTPSTTNDELITLLDNLIWEVDSEAKFAARSNSTPNHSDAYNTAKAKLLAWRDEALLQQKLEDAKMYKEFYNHTPVKPNTKEV